jgi:hypothetical protein
MLVLISRLGLRASEVVELTLDDIDWTEGTIHIRGPAQRCRPSAAAGRCRRQPWRSTCAMAALRCSVRNVFIRSRAPRARAARPERRQLRGVPRVASAPESIRPSRARTCCATRWPHRCSAGVPRSVRSVRDPASSRLADHHDLREGRPRARCMRWPFLGRELRNEAADRVDSRVSGALRRSLGFKLHDAGARLAEVRIVHGPADAPTARHHGTGAAMGAASSRCAAGTLGAAPGLRSRLRAPPPRQRSAHRGSTARLAAVPPGPRTTVPVFGRRGCPPARTRASAATNLRDCGRGPSTRCWDC